MSECDRYLEMISQLVDDELPEPQKTGLFKHLDSCVNCRRVYDAFNAISLSLGETAVPEDFAEGVMAAVRTQGGHGSSRAKKPGKSPVRYLALAACICLAVLATVRLALPSESMGAAAGEPQPAQFGVAAAPGELDPRAADSEEDGQAADSALPEDGASNKDFIPEEQPAESETPAPANDGVDETAPEVNGASVEQFGADSTGVSLDAEQITSIEISCADGSSTITDSSNISLIAELLSPSGQAQDTTALDEVYCSVSIYYTEGSAELNVYVSGNVLVCEGSEGTVYSAVGSPDQLMDALK